MNQQKGFSLIEVLLSLMLVMTLALLLLQQQWQTRQLINQLVLYAGASQFLDQIDEALYAHADNLPGASSPYHFILQRRKHHTALQIDWSGNWGLITRRRNRIGLFQ